MSRALPGPRPDPHARALDARLARSLQPITVVLGIMYLSTVLHRAVDPALQATTAPTAIVPAVVFLGLGLLLVVRPLPAPLANPVLLLAIGLLTVEALGRSPGGEGDNLHWALIGLGAVVLRTCWAWGSVGAVVVPWALVAALGLNGWSLDQTGFVLDMATATALGMVIFTARRRDVLGALEAHAALSESRSGYRRLMAVLQDGVVRLDGLGRIQRMNPRAETLLGTTEAAASGLAPGDGPWRFLAPDGSPMDPADLPSAVVRRTGAPVERHLLGVQRVDGTVTWVTENAAAARVDDAGTVAEVVVSLTDVTPLREALDAASRSEARVREVIETAGDLILVLDPAGRVVFANPAVARVTGYEPAAIPGLRPIDAVEPEDRGVAIEALAHPSGDEGGTVRELRVRHADGGLLWFEVRAHRLADGNLQLIARDVTARRALESERDLLEAKLARTARLESIGQLAGGVAHDFNNLLTAILGHVELARDQAQDRPVLAADLAEIERAAQRAQVLTRQLLAFGRRSILRPRPVRLAEVAADLEPMLGRLIGEDIELVVVRDVDPGPVIVDPDLLQHALVNLVVNARDAMPAGGRIEIVIGPAGPVDDVPEGRWAVIRVRDTGSGIPAEVLDRLFEPFYSTKPEGRGTGLGLAMVHGFVAQSGGHLRVSTGIGTGSCFAIVLPLAGADRDDGHEAGPGTVASGPALGAAGRAAGTVLVAEDEAMLRAIAERTLSLAGYRVLLADSGESALRLAAAHPGPIDLLFTDIVMPGMTGIALATELRATRDDLRVLVTSGYTEDEVSRRGLSTGDLPFLAKPYSPTALAEAVAGALR
jgi:PAS domain S-box-containing protein